MIFYVQEVNVVGLKCIAVFKRIRVLKFDWLEQHCLTSPRKK